MKASKQKAGKKVASRSPRRGATKGQKAVSKKASKISTARLKKPTRISKRGGKTGFAAPASVVRVAVKPLEPQAKCGAGTSVQYLFRVDESVDGRTTTHLVFFDRHGWYCEHGRNCPAVGHAKKYQGHMARAS